MNWKRLVVLALALALILGFAGCGNGDEPVQTEAPTESQPAATPAPAPELKTLTPDVKEATEYTKEINAQVYQLLDFSDEQEREFAERGFITAPDSLEIHTESGGLAWSQSIYDFAREVEDCPDSANPSLWRNLQLNAMYGLYEVAEGIYQVRGYDVANISFVKERAG